MINADPLIRSMLFGHGGLEIVVDNNLPGEWEFPYHDFFEYEPKDEYWCRMLGIGREVCRTVYKVAMSPEVKAAIEGMDITTIQWETVGYHIPFTSKMDFSPDTKLELGAAQDLEEPMCDEPIIVEKVQL